MIGGWILGRATTVAAINRRIRELAAAAERTGRCPCCGQDLPR